MGDNHLAFGKGAAMSVAMQIIHHNHPELRYRRFVSVVPANVDDFRMKLRYHPCA
jgi:hypothetical protein